MRGFLALLLRCWMVLALAGMSAAAGAQPEGSRAAPPSIIVGVPTGFDDLVREQRALVDVFFGGRQVATAEAVFGPGRFRFVDAAALVRAIPAIAGREAVTAALSDPALDDHRALGCGIAQPGVACGGLRPAVAAIVFTEQRFRVDLFVNPTFLATRAAAAADYLPAPQPGFSLTHAFGGTLAGAAGQGAQFTLGNSAILGLGAGRVRSELSWSSGRQPVADLLVAELDQRDWRISAGAFWAPGTELTGRRKVLGMSLASQTDTRVDRDQLQGLPLVVFLDQRARVDLMVGGRLVSTELYEAGNQALDTASLPDGSYEVIIRVTTTSGARREERRFFTRSNRVPPLGRDAWVATAGVLVNDADGRFPLGAISRTPIYQLGWAHRVSPRVALRAGAVGGGNRHALQLGGTLIGRRLQVEASVLAAPGAGWGVYAHAGSPPGGRLSFNLDGRIVTTRDGKPLLPEAPAPVWIGPQPFRSASYAQASGDLAYQLGRARLAVAGSWTRAGGASRYSVGPNLRVPLVRTGNVEIVASGDYAFTERGRAGYIGLGVILSQGRKTFTADAGLRHSGRGASRQTAGHASLRGTVSSRVGETGEAQLAAGLSRDETATYALAEASLQNRTADFTASLARAMNGPGRSQYALSFRTGMAVRGDAFALGAAEGGEAAVVARVVAAPEDRFEVLINDVPRANLAGGQKAMIPLPAYRAYDVRIRAIGGGRGSYDTATRRVSLYPGSVAALAWRTRPALAIHARIVGPDGAPLARAAVAAGDNIAESDGDGSFVIQLDDARALSFRLPDGRGCTVPVGTVRGANGFAALGTLSCSPAFVNSPAR